MLFRSVVLGSRACDGGVSSRDDGVVISLDGSRWRPADPLRDGGSRRRRRAGRSTGAASRAALADCERDARGIPGYPRDQTIDEVIGALYSTSFAAKRLFGDRVDDFESELRKRLYELEPSGTFSVRVGVTALLAARRP